MDECPEKEATTKLRGDVILAKFLIESLNRKAKEDSGDYMWILDQLKIINLNDSLLECKEAQRFLPAILVRHVINFLVTVRIRTDINVTMHRWLSALKRCISIIQDDQLLTATLSFPWFNSDSSVVYLYIDYIQDLVSSHPKYLHTVLYKLCSLLFCPDLKDDILKLILLKMLQIDVEIPHSPRGNDDGTGGDDTDGDQIVSTVEDIQFDVDMDTEMATSNSLTDDKRSYSPLSSSLMPLYSSTETCNNDPKEETIDIMMNVMFEYIRSQCLDDKTGKIVLHSTIEMYELLLKIFEQQILLTHGSSHVQFLLFTIASYDESIPVHFLDFLWEKFQDTNMAAVCRQACALYIAGFIARSKCVSLSTSKLCLAAMMEWIHQYMGLVSANNLRPDVARHGPFYTLCQAVFYVVIFRHKQILESDNGHRFLIKLEFNKLILNRLNPLKVCLSSIVDMFASVTWLVILTQQKCKHEIAFCYAIIEQNKRLMLPVAAASSSDLGTSSGSSSCYVSNLSTFFPFDPYSLSRSAKFVSCVYQNWEESEDNDEHYFTNHNKTCQPSILLDQSPSSYGSLILNLTTP